MWKMLLVNDDLAEKIQQPEPFEVYWWGYGPDWETRPPENYLPKLNLVGQNARKIFLMDGCRYVADDERIDYDYRRGGGWQGDHWGAGSFSSSGPVFRFSREYGLKPDGTPMPGQKHSYRHPQGDRLGLLGVFFDGHAEYLSEQRTRHIPLTAPTGSTYVGGNVHPGSVGLFEVGDRIPD